MKRKLRFSPDGSRLAMPAGDSVLLWGPKNRRPIRLGFDRPVGPLAFSPASRLFALAAGDRAVSLRESESGRELARFRGHPGDVTAVAFSPDGKTLATGGTDGVIKLYGTRSLHELLALRHPHSVVAETHALQGSEDVVLQLAFTSDGRRLL